MSLPQLKPNRLTAILSTTLLISVVLVAVPCGSKSRRGDDAPNGPDPVTEEELPPPTEIGRGLEGATPDDSWSDAVSAPALTLPGLGEYVLEHAGRLTEFEDGSATLHGQLASTDHLGAGFRVELFLTKRVDPGHPSELASPALDLHEEAYVSGGGPVDPTTWTLFDHVTGRLVGIGDHHGGAYDLALGTTPLHLGTGASGRNARFGLAARFDGTRTANATGGPFLPETIHGAALTCDVLEALSSCVGANLTGGLEFTGWGARFVPVARGSFVEDSAGFGTLTQTVVEFGTADRGFELEIEFFDPVSFGNPDHAPGGSPVLEMSAASYTDGGGQIEPDHWRYYREARGTARGVGTYEGVEIELSIGARAAQVGFGAEGRGQGHGTSATLAVESITEETPGTLPASPGEASLHLLLPRLCAGCTYGGCASFAHTAAADAEALVTGGVALSLPGIATDLVLQAGSAWVEDPLGRVQATGVLQSQAQPFLRFAFELHLGGRLEPDTTAHATISLPRELATTAYVESGGPVDPAQWVLFTEADVVLTGLEDATGSSLIASLDAAAAATGSGASGRNVTHGFGAALSATVHSQPDSGGPWPANVTGAWAALDLDDELTSCAVGSLADPATGITRGRSAVSLDGIGATFEFEDGVRFVEGADGRAKLVGRLVDSNDDDRAFRAEFDFGGRLDPGVLGHPAEPGPQELLPSWYFVAEGGPVDSNAWSYYREIYAALHGEGELAGAFLILSREGPAVQVGVGANGESTAYGLRGTFSVESRSWPGSFPAGAGQGTIQLELPVTCP